MLRLPLIIALFVLTIHAFSQNDILRMKIDSLLSGKDAVVGVAVWDDDGKEIVSLNGDMHFPMQSVFKLHISLVMLSEIDKGRFSADQKIRIDKKDLLPVTWSPIRDKYPDGCELTIAEIIDYTVAQSDNNGCDILLRMLGGPAVVEDYFREKGFRDISIKANEEEMHRDWNVQFSNYTTPRAANDVLMRFFTNREKLLMKKSHDFIWNSMTHTTTGPNRIKAGLPEGAALAHKTGSSGKNEKGITAALNDIGVITYPDGRHIYISVFVSDSKESDVVNERIIAEVVKIWTRYDSINPRP